MAEARISDEPILDWTEKKEEKNIYTRAKVSAVTTFIRTHACVKVKVKVKDLQGAFRRSRSLR